MMNYDLLLKGIASMHCSVNVGNNTGVAIFFELSGSGKTTLSTDPYRKLIRDDVHGWNENDVFYLDRECYAKVNGLNKIRNPIYFMPSSKILY